MERKKITTITCFIAVLMTSPVLGTVRYVPKEYANIQEAINACQDLDTVVIEPGKYVGSGNREINFGGKAITVRGTDPTNSLMKR
jgi:hypothetical protein